jgi:hypothetical protein
MTQILKSIIIPIMALSFPTLMAAQFAQREATLPEDVIPELRAAENLARQTPKPPKK